MNCIYCTLGVLLLLHNFINLELLIADEGLRSLFEWITFADLRLKALSAYKGEYLDIYCLLFGPLKAKLFPTSSLIGRFLCRDSGRTLGGALPLVVWTLSKPRPLPLPRFDRCWLRGRLSEDALSNNTEPHRIRYSCRTDDISNTGTLTSWIQVKLLREGDAPFVSAVNMGLESR